MSINNESKHIGENPIYDKFYEDTNKLLMVIKALLESPTVVIHCEDVNRIYYKYKTLSLTNEQYKDIFKCRHGYYNPDVKSNIFIKASDMLEPILMITYIKHVLSSFVISVIHPINDCRLINTDSFYVRIQPNIDIYMLTTFNTNKNAYLMDIDCMHINKFGLLYVDANVDANINANVDVVDYSLDEKNTIQSINEFKIIPKYNNLDIMEYNINNAALITSYIMNIKKGYQIKGSDTHLTFHYYCSGSHGIKPQVQSEECIICKDDAYTFITLQCNKTNRICIECFIKIIIKSIRKLLSYTHCIWCQKKILFWHSDNEENENVYY